MSAITMLSLKTKVKIWSTNSHHRVSHWKYKYVLLYVHQIGLQATMHNFKMSVKLQVNGMELQILQDCCYIPFSKFNITMAYCYE